VSGRTIVFSDLDGCLLERGTYGFAAAQPALAALRAHGVPLVLCSGKTRAEMEPLAERLGLRTPLVVENGGALVAGARVLALGVPRARLVAALPALARDAGVDVRGFAEMTADEVSRLTGLDRAQAALALQREFDEPFAVLGASGRDPALDARLDAAARGLGLRVTHGGFLHHLHGPADKGDGVRAALRLEGDDGSLSLGLGDAATDLPLLQAVSRPIVVPGPDGVDPALAAALPRAERAPAPGPAGWNDAVLAALSGTTLALVSR
jgi:mannosyl-3-phosphoglycerate phosphatase family protein